MSLSNVKMCGVRWGLRLLAAGALFLTCAAVSSPAVAAGTDGTSQSTNAKQGQGAKLLATGKELFEDQRYEESIQTLSAALLRPNLSKKQRIEVYRYLAYNYITLSRLEEADAAVRGLFSLDPDFQLGENESPRFRNFFDKTRKKWEQEGRPGLVKETKPAPVPRVRLEHVSPAQWERGKPLAVRGSVVQGADRVAKVVVHFRVPSSKKYRKLEATLDHDRFQVVIPATAIKPPLLEYYIEAIGPKGLPVATRGDVAAPLRVSVPREEATGLLSSPWFWVAATVLAAGGATTAYLLTRDNTSSPPPAEEPGPNMSQVIVVIGE